jgi:hypothetical protein
MLHRITAPHFVAGFECDANNRIIRTAPILGYALRNKWSLWNMLGYCEEKGWLCEPVETEYKGTTQ